MRLKILTLNKFYENFYFKDYLLSSYKIDYSDKGFLRPASFNYYSKLCSATIDFYNKYNIKPKDIYNHRIYFICG